MMRATILVHPEVERKRTSMPGPVRPYHVLLVEDDDEMRKLIARVLRRSGFHVQEARDGFGGMNHLADATVDDEFYRSLDLLLTDQRMPGFQGIELIEAARCAGIKTPAILITAFADDAIHARVHALGDACVLDKPFEMLDLVTLARTVAQAGRA